MTSGRETCEHNDTWQRIEAMLDRVADLSRADVSEADFYGVLLREAVQAGAAIGGRVWSVDQGSEDPLIARHSADGESCPDFTQLDKQRPALLARIRTTGRSETTLVNPRCGDAPTSSTPVPVVACPVTVDDRVVRILEIVQRPDTSPATRRGYLDVLCAFCELAADFHLRARLRQGEQKALTWEQLDRFCQGIHSDLRLDATGYTIANEAKRLVACDRVTVAAQLAGGYRVLAVSGVDAFDRRATTIRLAERLIERVAAVGEPLWYNGQTASLPPEMETAVQQYVDVTHSRTVSVIPLSSANKDDDPQTCTPTGVLVFESFDSRPSRDAYRQSVLAVSRHAARAVHNAARFERVPAVRLLERLGAFASARTWSRVGFWALPILVVLAILVFVPADFCIRSDGRLQPEMRRRIFAPRDGQVQELYVQHGQLIEPNTIVASMWSSELEYEITRVLGEIQTTTEQYDAVRASRMGANPANAVERDEYARLTAEEERLGKLLANLEEQRELLETQQKELQVRSPIAGQVVTWDLEDQLQLRPVQRGQLLMTVADIHGPWVLELQVPDRYLSHILKARQALRPDLEVQFMLATSPERSHRGRLQRLAAASEPDDDQQLSATAWVSLDHTTLTDPRPGAGVTARIHCGRRPLGYVWLHDLIAAVRSKLFL